LTGAVAAVLKAMMANASQQPGPMTSPSTSGSPK